MNMTKEQIGLAVQSGLELLGPESDVVVPVKLNDGVFLLKQLLASIATGKIALNTVMQDGPPEEPPTPPTPPNRKTRRAAKKVAKKKATRKKKP